MLPYLYCLYFFLVRKLKPWDRSGKWLKLSTLLESVCQNIVGMLFFVPCKLLLHTRVFHIPLWGSFKSGDAVRILPGCFWAFARRMPCRLVQVFWQWQPAKHQLLQRPSFQLRPVRRVVTMTLLGIAQELSCLLEIPAASTSCPEIGTTMTSSLLVTSAKEQRICCWSPWIRGANRCAMVCSLHRGLGIDRRNHKDQG